MIRLNIYMLNETLKILFVIKTKQKGTGNLWERGDIVVMDWLVASMFSAGAN